MKRCDICSALLLQVEQLGLVIDDLLQQQPAFLAEIDGAMRVTELVVALLRVVEFLAHARQLLIEEGQHLLGFALDRLSIS